MPLDFPSMVNALYMRDIHNTHCYTCERGQLIIQCECETFTFAPNKNTLLPKHNSTESGIDSACMRQKTL